jgi:hypothetical protein
MSDSGTPSSAATSRAVSRVTMPTCASNSHRPYQVYLLANSLQAPSGCMDMQTSHTKMIQSGVCHRTGAQGLPQHKLRQVPAPPCVQWPQQSMGGRQSPWPPGCLLCGT